MIELLICQAHANRYGCVSIVCLVVFLWCMEHWHFENYYKFNAGTVLNSPGPRYAGYYSTIILLSISSRQSALPVSLDCRHPCLSAVTRRYSIWARGAWSRYRVLLLWMTQERSFFRLSHCTMHKVWLSEILEVGRTTWLTPHFTNIYVVTIHSIFRTLQQQTNRCDCNLSIVQCH